MTNTFDDDRMFLRHIRQQLRDTKLGNLQNEQLMQSLNRPSTLPPFYTETIPGNPGRFVPSQPLQFPGSEISKTSLPPQSGINTNILQSLSMGQPQQRFPMQLANNQPPPPKPQIPITPPKTRTIEEIMEMLKGGDRKMKGWWK